MVRHLLPNCVYHWLTICLNGQKLDFSQLYVGWCKCTATAYIAIPIFTCIKTCHDKFMITPFSDLEFNSL